MIGASRFGRNSKKVIPQSEIVASLPQGLQVFNDIVAKEKISVSDTSTKLQEIFNGNISLTHSYPKHSTNLFVDFQSSVVEVGLDLPFINFCLLTGGFGLLPSDYGLLGRNAGLTPCDAHRGNCHYGCGDVARHPK